MFASCFYLGEDGRTETFGRRVGPVAGQWKHGRRKPACVRFCCRCFVSTRQYFPSLSLLFLFLFFSSVFLTPSRPMTQGMTPPKNYCSQKERGRQRSVAQGQAANRKGKDRTGNNNPLSNTHIQNQFFSLGTGTHLKKLSQDGNTIPMFFF